MRTAGREALAPFSHWPLASVWLPPARVIVIASRRRATDQTLGHHHRYAEAAHARERAWAAPARRHGRAKLGALCRGHSLRLITFISWRPDTGCRAGPAGRRASGGALGDVRQGNLLIEFARIGRLVWRAGQWRQSVASLIKLEVAQIRARPRRRAAPKSIAGRLLAAFNTSVARKPFD